MLNPTNLKVEVTTYLNDSTLFDGTERLVNLIVSAQRYILGSVINKRVIRGVNFTQDDFAHYVANYFSALFEDQEKEHSKAGKEFKELLFNSPVAHLPPPLTSINVMLGEPRSSIIGYIGTNGRVR